MADFSYTTSFASSLVGSFQFSGTAPADAKYYWTFGHGTASSTQKNPQHTFPGQGDYNVCLTISSEKDTCSSQVCKLLEVNQGCLAMFYCANTGTSGLVNFSATSSVAQFGTIISYEWSFGDGQTGTGVNVAHQYSCDGDKTVTLTITTSTGCKNTFTKKARVASFNCCDNNVKKDDSYSTGSNKKVNVKAWDVQFLWWNNAKSRMSHYKKVVIWWPNRQKLRSDLVGNVYIKNQTGCACYTTHNVAESDTKNNWWRLVVKHNVGERFNTKLNNEWRAKYWVNDVAYPDLVPQVSCNQSNCN